MSMKSWFSSALLVACTLLCGTHVSAQTAYLTADINSNTDASYSSNPDGFVEFNEIGYFFATSAPGFPGLWRTDGTDAGTQLLKDGLTGDSLLATGIGLFFVGSDGTSGNELWHTDGSAQGTRMVKDIYPGLEGALKTPNGLHRIFEGPGGLVYFAATDPGNGSALWKSDGTEAGTEVVKPIDATFQGGAGILGQLNNVLYFGADDGINGRELWRTDGTTAGTTLVREITPGPAGTYLSGFAALDDTFVFAADDGTNGYELWSSDGTTLGTSLILDLNPGAGDGIQLGPHIFPTVSTSLLFFSARTSNGGSLGLWRSDGTALGTELIDLDEPHAFAAAGGMLFYLKDDEIWRTDGTALGTELVREFLDVGSSLVGLNGFVYFSANDGALDNELWKTDGNEEGTSIVRDIVFQGGSNPAHLHVYRGNPFTSGVVLFNADDGIYGFELWKTDGFEEGTALVQDIGVEPGSSNPEDFALVGPNLYFTAASCNKGRTEWVTDGEEVDSVRSGRPWLRGPRFFVVDDDDTGSELW